MTLLSICQDAAVEIGVPKPSTVIGNADPIVMRLLRYAKREGAELVRRGNWQALRSEKTFVSLAQESQTAMVASDLDHFINDTFWNRSQKRRLYGPKTPEEWQLIKGAVTSAVFNTYTYMGNAILINPVPAAGETFAYEYVSNQYCLSAALAVQAVWTADTDTPRLREELFTLGVIYRYKKGRGLPFADDFSEYDMQVQEALMLDKPKRVIGMSGDHVVSHGISVPEGSWTP